MANRRSKPVLQEYGEAILVAIVLALLIRTFIVQAFKIPSGSMIPTLSIGDHILVNKFVYGIKLPFTDRYLVRLGDPKRASIVVFKFPGDETKDYIKRIIGLPGDRVEIRDKRVYISGEPLEEPYAVHSDFQIHPAGNDPRDNFGPFEVPRDSYFMMGDNRDNSNDSRFWGTVQRNKIRGRAFIIYMSCSTKERDQIWGRVVAFFECLANAEWGRVGRLVH